MWYIYESLLCYKMSLYLLYITLTSMYNIVILLTLCGQAVTLWSRYRQYDRWSYFLTNIHLWLKCNSRGAGQDSGSWPPTGIYLPPIMLEKYKSEALFQKFWKIWQVTEIIRGFILWIHFEKDVSNPNCLQGRVQVVFLDVTSEKWCWVRQWQPY